MRRRANPEGIPVVGCLLVILIGCVSIWLAATVIHFLGPLWLFVIVMALLIAAMMTA